MAKEKRKVMSESELKANENQDNYERGKILKNVLLYVSIFIVACLVILLIHAVLTNSSFRESILNQVSQNIAGIVFFLLYIIGIKVSPKTPKD